LYLVYVYSTVRSLRVKTHVTLDGTYMFIQCVRKVAVHSGYGT
jgi:hypothetical protein